MFGKYSFILLFVVIINWVGNSAVSQEQIPEDLLNEVQLALLKADLNTSSSLLDTLIIKYPNNAQSWYYQGLAYKQQMNHLASSKSFRRALDLDPGNLELFKQMSLSCYDKEAYSTCILYTDSILRIDSMNWSNLRTRGLALQRVNRFLDSKNVFLRLYQQDSLNTWYIKQLGGINTKIDSINEAIYWYTKAIEVDSMDIRSFTHLGSLFVKSEQYNEGLPILTTAIGRDSSNPLLFRFRGSLGIMAADFKAAEVDFKKAIELGDSIPFTFRHYGLCLFKQSKYKQAIPVYETTLVLDPEDSQAWYYLGFCYKWQEDVNMAIACLDKSLQYAVSPSIADVYNGLGQMHGLQRSFEKAKHNYSRAYEWKQDDPVPLAQLGMLTEQSGGKKEHAKTYYKAYLEKANPIKNPGLINYVNNRMKIINEKLFMEGKLEKDE